jgi:hypothetical protein
MMKRVVTAMLAAAAILAAGLAAAGGTATTANAAAGPGGSWGRALPVAGLAAIGAPNDAYLTDVSCGAPGDCVAVGWYLAPLVPGGYVPRPFLVEQVNGVWGAARRVPGLARFGTIYGPRLSSVSCPSAGNCAAVGDYATSDRDYVWVINETGGTWGTPRDIKGIPGAIVGYIVYGLSCASAGNCAIVGTYQTSTGPPLPFVVDEHNGVWGAAHAVTGFPRLGSKGSAFLSSVSCPAAGDCAAAGLYRPSYAPDQEQAFVVSETDGTWGTPLDVPGTPALASGLSAWSATFGISCASAGNCTAGGEESGGVFIANETGGTWTDAQFVPSPNGTRTEAFGSLSCASAGDCAIGASFPDEAHLIGQVFVADEVNGTIVSSQQIPGTAALNTVGPADVASVSCAPNGSCAAGGQYLTKSGSEAFVVSEANGTWGTAAEVPGTAGLNADGEGTLGALSCASTGYCSGIGSYMRADGRILPYLVTEATATSVRISVNPARARYGDENRAVVRATVTAASGGKPAGTVTITNGGTPLCMVTLTHGTGTCALAATSMHAGIRKLTGWYNGDPNDVNATSAAVTVTVTRAATRSVLALSRTTVTYGHETSERLTVTVTPQFRGTPAGEITIKAGRVTLCTIRLNAGSGGCTLSARQLGPGSYQLAARYAGGVDFTPSASSRTLTVAKQP